MVRNKKSILVVDDEAKIVEVLSSFLESKGFAVLSADSGKKALELLERERIVLMVLDLMLPDISGEEVCRSIRKKSRVPILMLTAKAGEAYLLEGFRLGADDYISKPFSLKELYARIEAVLRRTDKDLIPLTQKSSWRNGDLIIDIEKRMIMKRQEHINLTLSEFNILSALIKYPGKVFTRTELIETALGSEFDGYDRVVDTHIKNIRQKIEDDPKLPVYVMTVHGLGYRFGGQDA